MSTTTVAPIYDHQLKRQESVDDEVDDEVRSNDDDDDAGSLVDFIVNDEEKDDDTESVESEPPRNEDEERARELDGIDTTNIIVGKRTRRQTKFYEQDVFNTDEYRRMVLEDVPENERHVLEESDDEEEEEEDEDGEYKESEEDDDDEDDDECNAKRVRSEVGSVGE